MSSPTLHAAIMLPLPVGLRALIYRGFLQCLRAFPDPLTINRAEIGGTKIRGWYCGFVLLPFVASEASF